MSTAANLERKKFNLKRLKEQQAEKKAEEEKLALMSRSNSGGDSEMENGRKKSSERMICRTQSTASNISSTSNLEDAEFDLDIEEGCWYDVFRDNPSPTAEKEDQPTPNPNLNTKGRKSKSPCSIGSSVKDENSLENIRHIEKIRRRLSISSSPISALTSPLSSKPHSIQINSLTTQKHTLTHTPNSRTPSNDSDKSIVSSSIFEKIITTAGQCSPKASSEGVNLVSLRDNSPKSLDHCTSDRLLFRARSGSGGSKFSNGRPTSDSFKDLRSRIDDQLFNS